MSISIGDYAEIESQNRVIKVCGFTVGHMYVPDGWIIDKDGSFVNPDFCKKYEGATSVLSEDL